MRNDVKIELFKDKLKPCPFCGNEPQMTIIEPHTHRFAIFMPNYSGGAFVECFSCTASISASNKADAIKKWNNRIEREEYE